MAYAILNFINSCIRNINDALGFTIFYEKIIMVSSIIFSVTILLTSRYDILNIGLYIFLLCMTTFVTISFGIIIFKIKGNFFYNTLRFNKKDFKNYSSSFFNFSKHLIPVSIIVFISIFFDRWLILNFYSASEQGYFTLAQKIAGTVFILANTILPLISRELSAEIGQDKKKKRLFYYMIFTVI